MAKKRGDVNSQKIKLLKLMDLLRRTSEVYSLSTEEIRSRLENIYANVDRTAEGNGDAETETGGKRVGIACHRHTLSKDIETLVKYGYDVENTGLKEREQTLTDDELEAINRWNIKRSRANRYYMPLGERFSNSELRLLELALQASKTIDDASKAEVIRKLRSQTLDSHVYTYLDNAFVASDENTVHSGKSSLIADPQQRRYFMIDENGEKLEVGDNCREFWSTPEALSLEVLAAVVDPIEEAILTGSLLRFYAYDRDIEGHVLVRADSSGEPRQFEAFPLSFVYFNGKAYLLVIYENDARKASVADIVAGRVDHLVSAFRLDSIYCSLLKRENFLDYDLGIDVVPQVKSSTRIGLRSSGISKSKKKSHASKERERVLLNVLRLKRWLAEKDNFDQLMRRNPHMFFTKSKDRALKEYTLVFPKKDSRIWRSLRDEFGSMVQLLPYEKDSDYCQAKVSIYSPTIFTSWLAGFREMSDGQQAVDKLRVVDVDRDLKTELVNVHRHCLRLAYGDMGAKDALVTGLVDDPSFDIRDFTAQLAKDYTRNGSDRQKTDELREALLDCLAWLR